MSAVAAQAMLFGLALGDALGYPVEFLNITDIRQRYGAEGITAPPDPARYSDDTQMTIAVAEALIQAGHADLDSLMQTMGGEFVKWLHSPENNRAPGNACINGTYNFERGIPWQEAGLIGSKGCGSAMRVAPLGYFYQHHPHQLKAVALASSQITHRHPTALAATVGAAYAVKLALDGIHPKAWLTQILHFTEGLSEEFDAALLRVGHVEGWVNRDAALAHIGQGWIAEEAVALALYCVRQFPDDYDAAVCLGANLTGDSDSVACIVGGMMGARLGWEALPMDWVMRCENADGLRTLAQRLAAHRQAKT